MLQFVTSRTAADGKRSAEVDRESKSIRIDMKRHLSSSPKEVLVGLSDYTPLA